MSAPRFFTDEDIYAAVAPALRKAGLDAVGTPETGRLGESDESQLTFAAQKGRVLVTFNVAHFAARHAAWMQQGRHPAGIVVSSQRPIGDMLRRLIHLASACDSDALRDRLEYLGDWWRASNGRRHNRRRSATIESGGDFAGFRELSMFDTTTLLLGVVFSAFGLGYFVYGRKQRAVVPLACGVALMVVPFVIVKAIVLASVGAVLIVLPYFLRF